MKQLFKRIRLFFGIKTKAEKAEGARQKRERRELAMKQWLNHTLPPKMLEIAPVVAPAPRPRTIAEYSDRVISLHRHPQRDEIVTTLNQTKPRPAYSRDDDGPVYDHTLTFLMMAAMSDTPAPAPTSAPYCAPAPSPSYESSYTSSYSSNDSYSSSDSGSSSSSSCD